MNTESSLWVVIFAAALGAAGCKSDDSKTEATGGAGSGGAAGAGGSGGNEFGCPNEALDGCTRGTVSVQLDPCTSGAGYPDFKSTVSLGQGDYGSCFYDSATSTAPATLSLELRHPPGSTDPDYLLAKVVGFTGSGTYDVNDVRFADGSADVRFSLRGKGGDVGETYTTVSASQGCPPCKLAVTARKDAIPSEVDALADYDITVTCGGQLGMGEGDVGQQPAGDVCSQSPAQFEVCTVFSQSMKLAARCKRRT